MSKYKINWYGTLGAGQGYSGSSEQTALALDRRPDTDVTVVSLGKSHNRNLSKAGRKLKEKPFVMGDIAIAHGLPVSFSSIQGYKYRVGYTMFETDTLPNSEVWYGKGFKSAADAINSQLDLLLTPSEWCVQMFRDNGVTIPIEVVPNGVNPQHFPYVERPERDTFTFLDMATLTIRKNPGAVIGAFVSLFKDNQNVRLILKTQSGTLGHLDLKDMGNITIIDELYTNEQMRHLVESADAFVFPSRGEGFGMPPIEAMASGLPTIVSYNTGMMDYTDEKWSYPVRTSHKSPAVRFPKAWGNVGSWYEPDQQHLKEQMLYVYEHQDEAREKGKIASKYIHDNFNYDVVAEKAIKAIDKLVNGEYNTK